MRAAFGDSADLVLRYVDIATGPKRRTAVVAYLLEMVDKKYLEESVIKELADFDEHVLRASSTIDVLRDKVLTVAKADTVFTFDKVISGLSSGDCAVLVDGNKKALVCDVSGYAKRSVEDPTSESTVAGSKEGFVEALQTNVSLLRRYIRSDRLRVEYFTSGPTARTPVAMAYIAGIASDRLVQEGRSRLSRLSTDGISFSLEEYIEDAPLSLFPTLLRTQRVDRAVGALLEGRLLFMSDGTPETFAAPVSFYMFLSTPEDYYERYWVGTALRWVRMAALFISLLLPGLYVAITTFHQELLPTPLILAIAAQREGVPFPALVEALLMEVLFEILREAGVRLPRIAGPAVSIIGALVLGDAAIRAGLVSPAMVVVVAATGVSSFAAPVPSFQNSVRLLRFLFTLVASAMGIYGMTVLFFVIIVYLGGLRSFGAPYLEPIAPTTTHDFQDSLLRVPFWAMKTRPYLVWPKGKERPQSPKPEPPKGKR